MSSWRIFVRKFYWRCAWIYSRIVDHRVIVAVATNANDDATAATNVAVAADADVVITPTVTIDVDVDDDAAVVSITVAVAVSDAAPVAASIVIFFQNHKLFSATFYGFLI